MNGVTENTPHHGSRTYRVEDIARILDISKASAYGLVKLGQFKTVKIGSAIRISKKSFDDWLDSQSSERR